jgi:hypothetical protein
MSCQRWSCRMPGRSLDWLKRRSAESELSSWVVLRVKSRPSGIARVVGRKESGCGGLMSAWRLADSRSNSATEQQVKDRSCYVRLQGGF